MTLAVYTVMASPHVLPFIDEIRRQYAGIEIKYITRGFVGLRPTEKIKIKIGWDDFDKLDYVLRAADDWELTWKILRECDILLCSFREIDLFEERTSKGKLTYYFGERWLRPYDLVKLNCLSGAVRLNLRLPGICRVVLPSFWIMVRRIVRLLNQSNFVLLPIGLYAACDIVRLRHLARGNWKSLFRCPQVSIERRLFAPIDRCPQIRLWAYFVSPSESGKMTDVCGGQGLPILLLWVGRIIECKRVDTIVRAVKGDERYRLTILGDGEEKHRLVRLIGDANNIVFHKQTDLAGVRRLMRAHDILILSSSSCEGWGAVASEALEEGMKVVGTYEAGSTATVLPESNLFHAGDVRGLKRVLGGALQQVDPQNWSAARAAALFLKDMEARCGK